ncbi:hypothetical protein AVEN_255883-1 [Araneus ventricosus]|uniref:Uncharacterized protein n=1 Tax=Araneus ventricosus TaxID=182803 RepID=A0A4Y2DG46_ARAVE|nr:hypothetical protein AVEN_255883-1 [Araneus ventricosus]
MSCSTGIVVKPSSRSWNMMDKLKKIFLTSSNSYCRVRKILSVTGVNCIIQDKGRNGLVLTSRMGFQVRNPIKLKICRVWGLLQAKLYAVDKRPPSDVMRKLGEGDATPGFVLVV